MAGRDLHTSVETALTSGIIRPVLIGRFDIATDPLTAWTGPGTFAPSGTGDTALDGQIFTNLAPFMEISEIKEDQGIGGPTNIVITGHDLDEPLLRQIMRDKRQWRGRNAWLWMGLLAADEKSIIGAPVRIKTGIMAAMNIMRDGRQAKITTIIDRDLGKASGTPFRWIDHQSVFSGDTWSSYILDLMNKPEGFTNSALRAGGLPKVGYYYEH